MFHGYTVMVKMRRLDNSFKSHSTHTRDGRRRLEIFLKTQDAKDVLCLCTMGQRKTTSDRQSQTRLYKSKLISHQLMLIFLAQSSKIIDWCVLVIASSKMGANPVDINPNLCHNLLGVHWSLNGTAAPESDLTTSRVEANLRVAKAKFVRNRVFGTAHLRFPPPNDRIITSIIRSATHEGKTRADDRMRALAQSMAGFSTGGLHVAQRLASCRDVSWMNRALTNSSYNLIYNFLLTMIS